MAAAAAADRNIIIFLLNERLENSFLKYVLKDIDIFYKFRFISSLISLSISGNNQCCTDKNAERENLRIRL
jgi:hypothetical protein